MRAVIACDSRSARCMRLASAAAASSAPWACDRSDTVDRNFTIRRCGLTVCAAAVLLQRPGAVTAHDLAAGLALTLPPAGLATAIAVFGITGVGATELVMYPYWCVEKGYARFVGPWEAGPAWIARARGWIRVMHFDILCSLVIYTLATVAFYLLGAAVLNRMGVIPAARDTVAVLSQIYTQTLGEWSLWVFYVGVVVTLYGTIFAATAAHSRMMADLVRLITDE